MLLMNHFYNDLIVKNVIVNYLYKSSLIIRYYLKQENSRKLAINKWILKTMGLTLELMFSHTLNVDNMHRGTQHADPTANEHHSERFKKSVTAR